jgi:hypothetical protein
MYVLHSNYLFKCRLKSMQRYLYLFSDMLLALKKASLESRF